MDRVSKIQQFDIPVVLLMYKRKDKIVKIIDVIRKVKPSKIYLISDGPRSSSEEKIIQEARINAEKSIDWDCEVIKNYSEDNRGVYENIGGGAKWVFSKEEQAIFLEDDNLPSVSFFYFCKDLLHKYENDQQVMWIMGTNYLDNYHNKPKSSYVYTQHCFPCGWASWSSKFLEYYDGRLQNYQNIEYYNNYRNSFDSQVYYKQQSSHLHSEFTAIREGRKLSSWDHQMEFSIRANRLLGVVSTMNLVENIGVDEHSIHGGRSKKNTMVDRFTKMKRHEIEFPLEPPQNKEIDLKFESLISDIKIYPFHIRLKLMLAWKIRRLFSIPSDIGTIEYFKKKGKK